MAIAVSEGSCARARRALSLVLDLEAAAAEIYGLALHLSRGSRSRASARSERTWSPRMRLRRP